MTQEKADKAAASPDSMSVKRVNYQSPYDSGGVSSAFSRFFKYEKGESEHAVDWEDDTHEYGRFLFTKFVDPNDPDHLDKTPNLAQNK